MLLYFQGPPGQPGFPGVAVSCLFNERKLFCLIKIMIQGIGGPQGPKGDRGFDGVPGSPGQRKHRFISMQTILFIENYFRFLAGRDGIKGSKGDGGRPGKQI